MKTRDPNEHFVNLLEQNLAMLCRENWERFPMFMALLGEMKEAIDTVPFRGKAEKQANALQHLEELRLLVRKALSLEQGVLIKNSDSILAKLREDIAGEKLF